MRKITTSIIATAIWWITLTNYFSKICMTTSCLKAKICYPLPNLIPQCCSCGASFFSFTIQILVILAPGLIMYATLSTISKFKTRSK